MIPVLLGGSYHSSFDSQFGSGLVGDVPDRAGLPPQVRQHLDARLAGLPAWGQALRWRYQRDQRLTHPRRRLGTEICVAPDPVHS